MILNDGILQCTFDTITKVRGGGIHRDLVGNTKILAERRVFVRIVEYPSQAQGHETYRNKRLPILGDKIGDECFGTLVHSP
jgi:hypothetical protein